MTDAMMEVARATVSVIAEQSPGNRRDRYVLETLLSSADLFLGVAQLLRSGLVEPAFVLCRPLFENAAVGTWLAVHPMPDEALTLAESHFLSAGARFAGGSAFPEAMTSPERRSERHWTGRSLHALIGDVETWADDEWKKDAATTLRRAYDGGIKFNQLFVHHSLMGLRPQELAAARTDLDYQTAVLTIDTALVSFNLVALSAFSVAGEPLNEAVQAAAQIPHLTPWGVLRRTGRNDPCPCESGKKFKSCCGRDRLPSAGGLVANIYAERMKRRR